MSQNSALMSWSREEVGEKLKTIMSSIHDACEKYGKDSNSSITSKVPILPDLLKLPMP